MLKKDEKLKSLENMVDWFKKESIQLASNIQHLTEQNKSLSLKLRESQDETKVWKQQAEKNKAYNRVLIDTIEKLKSQTLIQKYEQNGVQKYL